MNDEQWKLLQPVYDGRLADATYPYPLGGYDEVMEETFERAGKKGEGARILDIWAGEGNLSAHFVAAGCEVTCVASGDEIASRLEARMPQASVIRAARAGHLARALRSGEGIEGALDALRGECAGGFDAVVCAGDLTGGRIEAYTACVEGIFARFLPGRKGVLCWADTSFMDEAARREFEGEEPGALVFESWRDALVPRRYRVQYAQVMPCMGIYKIRRR